MMVNSTSDSVENLTSVIVNLTRTVEELNKKITSLEASLDYANTDNALLLEENKYLKRKLYGTKSETSHSLGFEQLSFFDEPEQQCTPELLEEISYTRSKKKHKEERKLKLENLKHIKEIYDIDEKDRICDRCGSKLSRVGEELVRSEVVYEPAKLYVKDIYRITYECRKCRGDDKFMMKAGTPNPVIPHSYASSSAVTQVIIDKYVNHMPLYRQEAEWKRIGLNLSRNTMANWIIISSKEYFIPLVNRMHEILLKETHVHSDETTVQVLNEPGKTATSKSYMWVYSSIKDSEHPIRIFEYRPDRKAINPQEFLKGFKGVVISDAYQGYNHIEDVTNAYCWAHVRRKFRDALPDNLKDASSTLPKEAISKIGKLFAVEKEIESLSCDDKVKIRQEKSKPLLDDFFSWCSNNQNRVLSRSKLGKAIQYALNNETGLREYLNDGLIPMTNSLDERTIRPFTVGRKNWLFSASTKGADASAAAFSLVETAKANQLDPYGYIEYLLDYMPDIDFINNPNELDRFLPWSKEVLEEFNKEIIS